MILLQPGITGFGTSAAVPVGDFKRALYAGAKTGGGNAGDGARAPRGVPENAAWAARP